MTRQQIKLVFPEYMKLRADGHSPSGAKFYSEESLAGPKTKIWWQDCNGTRGTYRKASWSKDGFDVHVRIVVDEIGPELDYLGKFTNVWSKNAIKRRNPGHNEYRYWIPARTYHEHLRDLRSAGHDKHSADCLARKYVANDMERHESFGESWYSIGIQADVFRQGVKLGSGSMWGIDSDSEKSYIDSIAFDVAEEAMREAKASLDLLVQSTQSVG